MLSLVFLIIFIISLGVLSFFVYKKWPQLKAVNVAADNRPLVEKAKDKIKNLKPSEGFSSEVFLKKFFVKVKILLLKGEKKVDKYLHRVSHSQKFEDDYWQKAVN